MMIENIIRTPGGIRFLDWEYSAASDYRFDLAMLCMKAALNEKEEEIFLGAYGIKDYDKLQQIKRMKAVVALREAAWGVVQLATAKIPYNYRKYAEDHFIIFRKLTRAQGNVEYR